MNILHYTLIDLSIGQAGLVWRAEKRPLLLRVILPDVATSTRSLILGYYPQAVPSSHIRIDEIRAELEKFDRGEDAEFSSDLFRLDGNGSFYEQVWIETRKIPRGKAVSYSGLAKKIGRPRAARAVGTALANNTLPLIVPCHRVIKSNGELGGFSAGDKTMKRLLLEKEGITLNRRDRVSMTIFQIFRFGVM
jgi:methylated-DNA-[protein]-cysteine S-methyltransferase